MWKNTKAIGFGVLAATLIRPVPDAAQNLSHNKIQDAQVSTSTMSYPVKIDDKSQYYPDFKFYPRPLGNGLPEGSTKYGNNVLFWKYLLVKSDNNYYVFYINEDNTIGASKVNVNTTNPEITSNDLAFERYKTTLRKLEQEELNKMMENGKLYGAIKEQLHKCALPHVTPLIR